MTQPTAPERLLRRLAVLPDACRAIEAAIDRARIRGGGEVVLLIEVRIDGQIEAVEVTQRYARLLDGRSTLDEARAPSEPAGRDRGCAVTTTPKPA